MKLSIVAFLFLYASVCAAERTPHGQDAEGISADYPVELDVLREDLDDQKRFERRARAFEKLHVVIARGYYLQARQLEEKGETEGALAASQKAQHHLQTAKKAYDMGLATFDRSAVLHNYYGELVHDFFGRPNEAAQHWRRAVQVDSGLARAHGNLGMYAMHNGMYAMGMTSMDRALELEPNNPDFLFNMAQVYLAHFPHIMQVRKWDRAKVYREAMKLSARATRFAPTDFDVLRDYALNYFVGEEFGVNVKWRNAARAWAEARKHARTDAERFNAWLNEARVHNRNNDKRRARECLERARAIWPDSPIVQQLIDDFRE